MQPFVQYCEELMYISLIRKQQKLLGSNMGSRYYTHLMMVTTDIVQYMQEFDIKNKVSKNPLREGEGHNQFDWSTNLGFA